MKMADSIVPRFSIAGWQRERALSGKFNGYHTIHEWNRRNFVRPDACEHCGEKGKRCQWALKAGRQHCRDRNSYLNLCSSCHSIYDDLGNKAWKKQERAAILSATCATCGETFTFPEYRPRLVCSRKCQYERMSENVARRPMVETLCGQCGSQLVRAKSVIDAAMKRGNKGVFCSRQCYWKSKEGAISQAAS